MKENKELSQIDDNFNLKWIDWWFEKNVFSFTDQISKCYLWKENKYVVYSKWWMKHPKKQLITLGQVIMDGSEAIIIES